jgi:IS5 family transposase
MQAKVDSQENVMAEKKSPPKPHKAGKATRKTASRGAAADATAEEETTGAATQDAAAQLESESAPAPHVEEASDEAMYDGEGVIMSEESDSSDTTTTRLVGNTRVTRRQRKQSSTLTREFVDGSQHTRSESTSVTDEFTVPYPYQGPASSQPATVG